MITIIDLLLITLRTEESLRTQAAENRDARHVGWRRSRLTTLEAHTTRSVDAGIPTRERGTELGSSSDKCKNPLAHPAASLFCGFACSRPGSMLRLW